MTFSPLPHLGQTGLEDSAERDTLRCGLRTFCSPDGFVVERA
jgi:hypothetical protein